MEDSTSQRRQIRSFVRREGKFSPRLLRAYEEFTPRAVLRSADISRNELETLANGRRIVVEIGSGQGNQIVHAASQSTSQSVSQSVSQMGSQKAGAYANPDTLYIGLEVYRTGVAHTLLLARNAGLSGFSDNSVDSRLDDMPPQNLYLFEEDAAELFRSGLFTGLIDELWTFFPDPWPKKRHNKRRLINENFKNLVQSVLKPGGIWRLATDWEDYANQMAEVLQSAPTDRFEGRILTNFEKKGIEAGRRIFDFSWINHCVRRD